MADGDIFGIPQDYFQAGTAALGAGSSIYEWLENYKRQQMIQRFAEILGDPRRLSAYIGKFMQPMSAAATQATQRDLNANWASLTGGATGGALNQYVADAFAKIETQRQQVAA